MDVEPTEKIPFDINLSLLRQVLDWLILKAFCFIGQLSNLCLIMWRVSSSGFAQLSVFEVCLLARARICSLRGLLAC
jgi:hypothetical protein